MDCRTLITYKAGPGRKAGVRGAGAAPAPPATPSPRWVCARPSPRARASTGTGPLPLHPKQKQPNIQAIRVRNIYKAPAILLYAIFIAGYPRDPGELPTGSKYYRVLLHCAGYFFINHIKIYELNGLYIELNIISN